MTLTNEKPSTTVRTVGSEKPAVAMNSATAALRAVVVVATGAGVSAVGVVAIATINAVGGGAFADILLDRSSFILFEDFYASCAVFGGFAYWLGQKIGAEGSTAAAICAIVTVVARLGAVKYSWNLPTVQKTG